MEEQDGKADAAVKTSQSNPKALSVASLTTLSTNMRKRLADKTIILTEFNN